MSQLTTLPLQDNYRTTLSQARDGNTWTVYVNTVPSFTFPAGVKTYICVDAGKTTMQVARISAYNSTTKTLTVDSISFNKANGVAYSAQNHSVGAVVEISDNYQFRDDIKTAINTKVNTNSTDTDTGKFADATARDAYFTSPAWWMSAYLEDSQTRTDYNWVSWGTRATQWNASTTAKWVVEISTQTETEDQTATWWTWATVVPTNATINPNNITSAAPATWDKISFADISNGNKLRSTTIQTAVDTARPLATNAEVITWTGTTQSITPLHLRNFAWMTPTAWTVNNAFPPVASLTTTSTTPTKKSEATVTRDWTYRITFTWSTTFWFWYIQVYKNWSAFWTLRAWTWWATYSEDLTFVRGDLLQLYMYNDNPWTCTCSNYSVSYNNYIMTNTTF